MASHLDTALALEAQKREARRDPLEYFRSATWAADQIFRSLGLDPPPDIYWHAGNSGAKTRSLVALDFALLSGRDTLRTWGGESIALPVIEPHVAGALVVPSFKVSAGSSLEALRQLVGDWPHHEGVISGAQDSVGIFYVKHRQNRSDDFRDWSRLYVFPHEGEVPQGLRLDFAHADEPPPERIWRVIRNRGKAGRPFFCYIGATPWEQRGWQWLKEDFPREQKRVIGGKLRLQSSVYDNKALSRADIARAEAKNADSPWRLAALFGEHVHIASNCPFDANAVLALKPGCSDGVPHVAVKYNAMCLRQHPHGSIRVWGPAIRNDRMLVIANPSSGIPPADGEKGSHLVNLTVVSIVQRKLLARFVGYITPPELGLMARAVCNGYRDWIFVPEMNGGWGEECLRSFLAAEAAEGSQGCLYQDVDPTSTIGNAKTRVGWWQTENRRNAAISALQRAFLERSLGIFSEEVLDNLLAVRRDKYGRYDDPETGEHPRDFLVLGMACSIMENPQLLPAALPQADESALEAFKRESGIRIAPSYDGYAPDDGKWR